MKATAYTFELNYKGVDISVHGLFEKGEDDTRDTPGTSDRFKIDTVNTIDADDDISEMDIDYIRIEEIILEKYFE